jgi:hypothetical protein
LIQLHPSAGGWPSAMSSVAVLGTTAASSSSSGGRRKGVVGRMGQIGWLQEIPMGIDSPSEAIWAKNMD